MTKTFVRKPFLALVAIVIVLTIGVVSLMKMQTNLMPDMELPYLAVVITEPGASAQEVEKDIIEPVESLLGTVNGAKKLSSTSADNYGMVMIEFADDTNMDSTLVRVSQKLNTLDLPDGCGTPNLMEISMDMMATMYANVDYEGKDIKELTSFVENEIKPYFEKQNGVASVSVSGGVQDSVEVRLNQDKIDEVNKKILTYTNEQLGDAQDKITKGKQKLKKAKTELEQKQEELTTQEKDTYGQLGDGQVQLGNAQATKAAYEATLQGMKASEAALNAELNAYKKAKVERNYKMLNEMFASTNETMGAFAKLAGVEIPTDVKEAIDNPKKFEKFKEWVVQAGYGDQMKDITVDSLKQLYDLAEVRIPQINTELANLKTEIAASEAILSTVKSQMEGMDKTHSAAIAGGYSAASGFSSGQAQMSAAKSQIESAENELKEAQKKLDASKEVALENANLDKLLTLDVLSGLITAQNFSMPAGYVDDENDNQWLVEAGDNYEDQDQINDMVLTKIKGVGAIKMSDVADITMVDNAGDTYSKVNGKDSVMLAIFKSSTASTGEVSNKIKKAFTTLEKQYKGLSFTAMMDQGEYISQILDSVLSSIWLGAILAIIVLALFLKDVRPTIVVAFSIPFSVLFAVIIMYFTGININVMSLAGLCLGIGMLVDNSIVVMENIYRLRGQGYPAAKAAVYGTKQVGGAIIASTITTICVFLPMVYTTGIVSQLLMPFCFTISYSLIASLLVAMTVVPTLASVTLKKTKTPKHRLFDGIKNIYGKTLEFSLRFKIIPLAIAIILLIFSVVKVMNMGIVMMDDMESNQISATLKMKKDTDKEVAVKMADQVAEKIVKVDGVEKVSVMAGGGSAVASAIGMSSSSDFSSFSINVITEEDVTTAQEFRTIIKNIEKSVKGMDYDEFTVSSSAMGNTGSIMSSGMQVNIYGDDQEQLIKISEDVMKMMNDIKGLTEISNGIKDNDKKIHLTFDKDKVAKKGLTVAQIFQQLAGKISTEKDSITLDIDQSDVNVTIINKTNPVTYENLMDTEIEATVQQMDGSSQTKKYKLSDFAKKTEGQAMNTITRENQTRYLDVTASTEDDANTTLLSRKLQKKIDKYQLEDGYKIEISGETEQVMEMIEQMILALALGLLLIYLVMVAQFQSLLSPFIVIFTVPLAFTGGMIGLLLFGQSLSAMSLMGFMILMGTVVNNGIVFVDFANQLRKKGIERRVALVVTGKTRMRPIIMTALTTILSMSVMVFSQDAGNAMQKGMAIVVCFGLIYSTFMTLYIVPVLYDIMYRRPPRNVDVGSDLDDIPDETEALLEENGYGMEA